MQVALAVARTLNHVEPRVAQLFVRDGMARGASRRESRKASHVELLGHAAEQIDRKRSERERNCSFSFRHHLFETDGRLGIGLFIVLTVPVSVTDFPLQLKFVNADSWGGLPADEAYALV